MPYIVYQGQKYDSLLLNMSKEIPFRRIFEQINSLSFPSVPTRNDHVRYALLELLGNSIRAHQVKGSNEEIRLALAIMDERLHITITDHGGGFDIAVPPKSHEFRKGASTGEETIFCIQNLFLRRKRFNYSLYTGKSHRYPHRNCSLRLLQNRLSRHLVLECFIRRHLVLECLSRHLVLECIIRQYITFRLFFDRQL